MFCHQFCYSGLVHPGFTGGRSPLEGKGRIGQVGLAALPQVQHLCRDPCGVRGTVGSVGMTHIWLEFLGCWEPAGRYRMELA